MFMKRLFLTITLAMCSISAGSATYAQTANCVPHGIISSIMEREGMALVSRPLVDLRNGSMGDAEVWASPEGQWAMIAVGPSGRACILFYGASWGLGEAT